MVSTPDDDVAMLLGLGLDGRGLGQGGQANEEDGHAQGEDGIDQKILHLML